MDKIQKVFASVLIAMFALTLVVMPAAQTATRSPGAMAVQLLGVQHTEALTDAEIAQIRASTTDAIDNQIKANYVIVLVWLVGLTFLFGFVGVILGKLWAGFRALGHGGVRR